MNSRLVKNERVSYFFVGLLVLEPVEVYGEGKSSISSLRLGSGQKSLHPRC